MRRHARSEESLKILRGGGGGAAAAAEIGSRVFPFRAPRPPPASMPTVGTRRSTRVFVPKQQQQQRRRRSSPGDPARVLRSGRRIALAEDGGGGWLKVFDGGGSDLSSWWRDEGWKKQERETVEMDGTKLFGTVYSRKRRRSSSAQSDARDRMFGVVFERRHRKKSQVVMPLAERTSSEAPIVEGSSKELFVAENSAKLGIYKGELWSGSECSPLVLAVVVDSSLCYSSERFERFLILVLSWMRRARVELMRDLLALTSCRSIAGVFSANGIRFLPVRQQKVDFLAKKSIAGCGFCMISGTREYVPLLFVDFSALPSFFKSLHAIIIHHSQRLPNILRSKHLITSQENSLVVYSGEHSFSVDPLEMVPSKIDFNNVSESPAVKSEELQGIADFPMPISHNLARIRSSKLRKHQKKHSSSRRSKARKLSSVKSPCRSLCYDLNSSSVLSTSKLDLLKSHISVKKQIDSCLSDLISSREESDNASSSGSVSKLRKSTGKKSPEKVKEYRPSLVEVRQNIDSVSCNVNILVIESDRGWREGGAQVMLEISGSHECFIAVKKGDVTRFLCKPQDLKPCVVNRFTHAYMWNSDDGWKLEFCDKWDWYVFKELHSECRMRNIQDAPMKLIPVPGVREVSGYEEDEMPSFVRPEKYLQTMDDEVGRALASEKSFYDMDLADEEWLRLLNSKSLGEEDGCCSISEENFESIVYSLEKNAYYFPEDAFDKEGALALCQGLGSKDMVSTIFDYWLEKRKQKEEPLVRVFQGQPSRRTLLFQKPFFRKKRSFKRQRSQAERNQADLHRVGRGKPYIFLQAEEDRQRYRAVESDAIRYTEIATCLRTRAQMLMLNADLAAYKAAMARRIAETIRVSSLSEESCDLESCILFDSM